MPVIVSPAKAPALSGGTWLQGGPLDLAALKGKRAVLVDFWDYTCVNCLRTLPYLRAWHERYEGMGLTIVGVHAPEFAFAKSADFVGAAVKRFDLGYPILVDSEMEVWRAFGNQYWPAKYLVDRNGYVIYAHFGEGSYRETETMIQEALRPLNRGKELPPLLEPVREEDAEGAVCHPVSAEQYCGYLRGTCGNKSGFVHDQPADYKDPEAMRREAFLYLEGKWIAAEEFVEFLGPRKDAEPHLAIRCHARGVNLVMAPAGAPVEVEIELDAMTPKGGELGEDVEVKDGNAIVRVIEPRMYQLLSLPDVSDHELRLRPRGKGLRAYAFTFTSCVSR